MKGFKVKDLELDPLGILKTCKLQKTDDGVLESHLGVIPLQWYFAEKIGKVLHKKAGDCHTFGWFLATGVKYEEVGPPSSELLLEHGLEQVGYIELIENENRLSREDHIRRMTELLSSAKVPIPAICKGRIQEGKFYQGDLLIKRYPSHITHSMVYIGNQEQLGPIFMSKIGSAGKLSIHTLGEIMTYYKPGTYNIFREESSDEDSMIPVNFNLPNGSYAMSLHSFNE